MRHKENCKLLSTLVSRYNRRIERKEFSVPDTELLRKHGWGLTSAFVGKRGTWTASRVVVRVVEGGLTETSTVLQELAREKFPDGWEENQVPYWRDKNLENETLENIELMTKQGDRRPSTGRPSQLALGVPSNSKEYRKKYREKRRERFKGYQKKYQASAREALREQRKKAESGSVPETAAVSPLLAEILTAKGKVGE